MIPWTEGQIRRLYAVCCQISDAQTVDGNPDVVTTLIPADVEEAFSDLMGDLILAHLAESGEPGMRTPTMYRLTAVQR